MQDRTWLSWKWLVQQQENGEANSLAISSRPIFSEQAVIGWSCGVNPLAPEFFFLILAHLYIKRE